jgi:excisionase family DNA binding protein
MSRPFVSGIYGYYPGFEQVAQALDECAEDGVFCDNCSVFLECRRWFDETVCQFHTPARIKERMAEYLAKITVFREFKKEVEEELGDLEEVEAGEEEPAGLSVKEAADQLGVSISQVYSAIKVGELESFGNGERGRITVLLPDIEEIDAAPVL